MAIYQSNLETNEERRAREILIARWGWQKFNQLFPDDQACIKELHRRRYNSDTVTCTKCAGTLIRQTSDRKFECLNCHKITWYTAGTQFQRARKIRPWFAAMWLHEQGIKVNGSQFAALAEVSQSTGALMVRRTARTVKKSHRKSASGKILSLKTAKNLIKLSDFKPVQTKNNSECTNADKLTPVVEFAALLKSQSAVEDDSNKEKFSDIQFEETIRLVYEALTYEPQSYERLLDSLEVSVGILSAAFCTLETRKLAIRLPGNFYVRTKLESESQKSESAQQLENLKQPVNEQRQEKEQQAVAPKATIQKQEVLQKQSENEKNAGPSILKSVFETAKAALQEISRIVLQGLFFRAGLCKTCSRKNLPKKI